MNATHLFEKPFREFHNSESWWSAFFSLFLLEEAQSAAPRSLPIWRYSHRDRYWKIGEFACTEAKFANLTVEASLCGLPFTLASWPQEYRSLKIDLVLIRDRHVTLIETKTIGASIAKNVLLYVGIAEHLRSQGREVELYHLISYGHETVNDLDWRLISEHRLTFLLWEDVFRCAASTATGRALGVDLTQYAELPMDAGAA